jgi:uncharacterized protein (TIGR04222 family)
MNPLDWSGPAFLGFYLAFGCVVCGLLVLSRRLLENGAAPRLRDPYAIAYLRGGAAEVLRVAVASLIGRGALEVGASETLVARPVAERQPALEEALLQHFAEARPATSVFRDDGLRQLASAPQADLERQGLLAGDAVRAARVQRFFVALALLWAVAGAKVAWALAHGRSNVGFLVALALLLAGIAWWLRGRGRLTGRGTAAIADLQRLLAGQRTRAAVSGSGVAEAALLAGVFGVAAFPLSAEPASLFRRSTTSTASSGDACGASCGSTCRSDSGGGDSGGGDGGGGDGGSGCGGCGGGGD